MQRGKELLSSSSRMRALVVQPWLLLACARAITSTAAPAAGCPVKGAAYCPQQCFQPAIRSSIPNPASLLLRRVRVRGGRQGARQAEPPGAGGQGVHGALCMPRPSPHGVAASAPERAFHHLAPPVPAPAGPIMASLPTAIAPVWHGCRASGSGSEALKLELVRVE